ALSTSDDAALNLSTDDFTIQAWCRPTGTSGASTYGTIYSKRNGGADFDYVLYRNQSNGSFTFSYGVTGSGRINMSSAADACPLDTRTHVSVVRKGNMLAIYVNGIKHNEQTCTGSIRNRSIPLTNGRTQRY